MKKILFIITLAFAFSLFNSEIANAGKIKVKGPGTTREDVWNAVHEIQESGDYEIKRVKIKHKRNGDVKGKIIYKQND
ncbi:MAG: hypothetical protein IJW75_03785 [Alphaproteobacteria bacterium]|nr:hypothetical protein [Alphaproteobacteria bacterium]